MEDEPYEICIICNKLRPDSEIIFYCVGCSEPICGYCTGTEKAKNHELRCERKHNKEFNDLVRQK